MPKTEATKLPFTIDEGKWRHKKRGTIYEITGTAILQAAGCPYDDATVVIYRGEDEKVWARPALEFYDGRFERVE